MMRCVFTLLLAGVGCLFGSEIKVLHLPATTEITRADLWYLEPASTPQAILVLAPGVNGNGRYLVQSRVWQDFADKYRLGLVGLSFASPLEQIYDRSSYYVASKASGELLLEGLREIYRKDLPLLLYGFSGGAHFVSSFVEWKPERVISWCAYSAIRWNKPTPSSTNPPGIVACGEDDVRLGASLIYFKQGRAMGKPWLWVCLGKTGHSGSSQLDKFVRAYFGTVLASEKVPPMEIDIDRKVEISHTEAMAIPSLSAVLPSAELFTAWKSIHEP